jgi:chromosome segregation ATPase
MSPTVTLVIDLIMVGLLVATIAYAIILNRQIVRLRESRGELAELIKGLNEAMTKAEAGVRSMKATAHNTGEGLQKTIDKAGTLRDELQFMIEAGNTLADRMSGFSEDRPKASRPVARPPALRPVHDDMDEERMVAPPQRRPQPLSDDRPREGEEGLSRAERELLRAIENRR